MPDRLNRQINGPRGSALLAISVLCFAHVVAFTPAPPTSALPGGLTLLAGALPVWVVSGLWFAAGVMSLVGAFTTRNGVQRRNWDAWGHGAAAGMLAAWGLIYFVGWFLYSGPNSRAWLTGLLYGAVAWLVSESARMVNPSPGSAHSFRRTPRQPVNHLRRITDKHRHAAQGE